MSLIHYLKSKKAKKIFLLLAAAFMSLILPLLSCKPEGSANNIPAKNSYTPAVAIAWNELAYTVANQHDQFYSFIGVRALTMMHIAIHDALNAIDPVYAFYAFKGNEPKADPVAAASQAAFEVLISVYPQRKDTIEQQLQHWLSEVEDGEAKNLGIDLGKQSAASILAMRENDGHQAQGDYKPMTKPGDYQYTPEYDWVWIPDFSRVIPFSLDSLSQFRSPPPPALNSKAYADSYNEVKAYGKKNSEVRTEDQTNFAHWWAEFAEHGWNRIGRITAAQQQLPLWEAARLFALINMDIYDIYLVSFDSKYKYDTWRPYTAIRAGDQDGNPATEADTAWEPEMLTPPWPEYPSAHAAVAAGGAEIVSHVYGTAAIPFTMESTSALPTAKTRSYTNLNDAANDCADSRIMNGYHYRFATEEGKRQGRAVAKHLYENFLQPLSQ